MLLRLLRQRLRPHNGGLRLALPSSSALGNQSNLRQTRRISRIEIEHTFCGSICARSPLHPAVFHRFAVTLLTRDEKLVKNARRSLSSSATSARSAASLLFALISHHYRAVLYYNQKVREISCWNVNKFRFRDGCNGLPGPVQTGRFVSRPRAPETPVPAARVPPQFPHVRRNERAKFYHFESRPCLHIITAPYGRI